MILIVQSDASADEVEYLALKESVNGVLTYTVSYNTVDSTSAEVSEIIDSKVVLVDNCFGTAELSRAMEVSLTEESGFETIVEIQGKVTGLGLNPFLSGVFEGFARRMHQKMEKQELTIAYSEEVKAAAGTRAQYRLDVYKVSYSGLMVFSVGSSQLDVPYKLTNKLRTELVSEPTEPCSGSTPTVTP